MSHIENNLNYFSCLLLLEFIQRSGGRALVSMFLRSCLFIMPQNTEFLFNCSNFSGRQLMSLDFLKEKTNPGGYGSLTALSGK